MGKCPAKNMSADWLDDKVWDDCVDFINNPGQLLDGLSPEEASNNVSTEHKLQLIASSLSQKDSEKQSILDLYRKQLITNKDVEDQLSKIINEKTTLEAKQKELKNALGATTDEVNRKKDVIMIRRASIVFPEPGGPTISKLCPPAAAISKARLATSCP